MRNSELTDLYDRHATAIYGFLLNVTRDPDCAKDLLQEVFLKVSKRLPPREIEDHRAYLMTIAWNAHTDFQRKRSSIQQRHDRLATLTGQTYATAADPDIQLFRDALANAMHQLPDEQRAVVHLRAWEEQTFEQIGSLLAISPNTASSRYRYALEKLRTSLRSLYQEIS